MKGSTARLGRRPRSRRQLPKLDPLEAAREEATHAKEGNLKLQRAVDALRTGLETIVSAEWDRVQNCPPSASALRDMAVNALNEYSRLTGQNWRRNPLRGSYAGDKSLPDNLEE